MTRTTSASSILLDNKDCYQLGCKQMIQENFINWLGCRKDYIMGLFDFGKAKDKGRC